MFEHDTVFRADRHAGHAANAVRVSYKLSAGYINVHGTVPAALATVDTARGIAADADETQHTPQSAAGTTCAEIVAEWAREEHSDDDEYHQYHNSRHGDVLAVHHFAEILRASQQGEHDFNGKQKIEHIPADLQKLKEPTDVSVGSFRFKRVYLFSGGGAFWALPWPWGSW